MDVNDFADGALFLIVDKIQREYGAAMIQLVNNLRLFGRNLGFGGNLRRTECLWP
jgi:hypothetical protein